MDSVLYHCHNIHARRNDKELLEVAECLHKKKSTNFPDNYKNSLTLHLIVHGHNRSRTLNKTRAYLGVLVCWIVNNTIGKKKYLQTLVKVKLLYGRPLNGKVSSLEACCRP